MHSSIHLHRLLSPCCLPRTRHDSSLGQLRLHCGHSLPGATAALVPWPQPPQEPRGLLPFPHAPRGRCSFPPPQPPASPPAPSLERPTTPFLQRHHPPPLPPIRAISGLSSVCLVPDVDLPSRSIGHKSPGTSPAQTTRGFPLLQYLPQSIPKTVPVPLP